MDTNHKSLLLEDAARYRGLPCRRLSYYMIEVEIGSRNLTFLQFAGPSASSAAKYICDHKHLAKGFLSRAGIPINAGKDFSLHDDDQIADFVSSFAGPAVIKPSSLSKARGVSLNVNTREEALAATAKVRNLYSELFGAPSVVSRILVEKQFPRSEIFRFFVVDDMVVSIIRQVPASVQGDGRSTFRELIRLKNQKRYESTYFRERLIPDSLEGLTALKRKGLSLDDVPANREVVELQDEVNVGQGGENIDMTEGVHPSYEDLAVQAMAWIPGMKYGGVDMFIQDFASPREQTNCAISEIEFSPGPTGMFPNVGVPRDIAGAIVDFYISRDHMFGDGH